MLKCKKCNGQISISNWWDNGYCDSCLVNLFIEEKNVEEKNRFQAMKAAGYSSKCISEELKIDKKTLEKWEKEIEIPRDDLYDDFKKNITCELSIEFDLLDKQLKFIAKKRGYSHNDQVAFQIDSRTAQYFIKPASHESNSLPKCVKCGEIEAPINNYEIIHGRCIDAKTINIDRSYYQTVVTKKKKLNMRKYSLPICNKCVKKQQLKELINGFLLTILAPIFGIPFYLNMIKDTSFSSSSSSGEIMAILLTPLLIISLSGAGIYKIIKSRNVNFQGIDIVKKIFVKVFPGVGPNDEVYTINEYKKTKFVS